MKISVRYESTASVVAVSGDVDMASSPRLRETLLELLQADSASKVIVNLEQVEYMDSSGVASLVEGLQAARRRNAGFVLAGLNEGPRHVLELTRLMDVFVTCPTEADALRS